MSVQKPRSLGIHDGAFHADEVTASALLVIYDLVDRDKIIRTREPDKLAVCEYVCDVGGIYDVEKKRFDHHQAQYQGDLSSAGMVLQFLKQNGTITDPVYDFFNNTLVKGVDAHDNGRSPQLVGLCSFSHVIANFNPCSYDATVAQQEASFQEVLSFVIGHLTRNKERFEYNLSCQKLVQTAMAEGKLCLMFEKAIPWFESFFALGGQKHPACFIIMPTREGWKLRGIPPNYKDRMRVRIPLPNGWAGLLGEQLQEASKIEGAIFCHKGRFTSVWKTKQDAIKALKIVLKMNGKLYEDPI